LQVATQDKLIAEDAMERLQADVTTLRTEKTELTKGLQANLSEQHELMGAHNSLRQAHVDLTGEYKRARHSLHIRYVLAIVFIVAVFTGFDFFWPTDDPVATDPAGTAPSVAETAQAPPNADKPRAKAHVHRSAHGH
jgi:hypothetical protein